MSLLMIVLMTLVLLAGDCLIRAASESQNPMPLLFGAGILWSSSIAGWYWIMKSVPLCVTGSLFSILSLVGTPLLGILLFKESMNFREWSGVALGLAAVFLLWNKG